MYLRLCVSPLADMHVHAHTSECNLHFDFSVHVYVSVHDRMCMYVHQEDTPTNNTETSHENKRTHTRSRDIESEPCICDTDKVVSGSPGGDAGGTQSSAEAGVLTPNLRPSTKAPNLPPLDTLSDEGLKGDENVVGEWSRACVHAHQRGDESVLTMDAVEDVLKPRLASDRCPSLSCSLSLALSLLLSLSLLPSL